MFFTIIIINSLMTEIHEMHTKDIVCLTLNEFCNFAKTHQALLFPAFEMQRALQQYTMGVGFWEKVSRRREELSMGQYVQVDQFVKTVSLLSFSVIL
jgi:hypothetical protein